MSSLLLTDTAAHRRRVRGSRGGRRVVVPLAEYRAARSGHPSTFRPAPEGYAAGAGRVVTPPHEAHTAGEAPGAAGRAGEPWDGGPCAEVGEPPLRLTRRGRVVARTLAGAALLLVVAGGVLVDRPALAGQEAERVPVTQHVVLPGETLWAIAGEVAPAADRRDTIAQIIELNDLPSAGVTAGQHLAVPVRTR